MDNYSEGLATGMALNQGGHQGCAYPYYPYPFWGMGGYGMGMGMGGFGFGGEWGGLIGLLIVASLFGGNGWGFGGNRSGNCATQADLAAGFSTSTLQRGIDDILLQNTQRFADVQQTLCQGFSGVNSAIANTTSTLGYNMLQGFNGIENALCTLGFQNQQGFNSLSNQISSCCCDLKQLNLENRYLNEKQTCDIIGAINAGNQRLVDIYNADKIEALRAENTALKGQISNDRQTANIVSQLRDPGCPIASYPVPNPNCCYNPFGFGVGNYGINANNSGCCGASIL